MIRQRLYNPAHLTPEELKASFAVREQVLEDMLTVIREEVPDRPCQHMMIIGQRGMGKTTLGLSLLESVKDDAELASQWQPVAFYEESYGIGDLAGFWLAALRHLTHAVEDASWEEKADDLEKQERDAERLAAYALAALQDFCAESGKRLILFVENFDGILDQFRDQRDVHALRAALIERPEFLFIGSASSVFGRILSHGEPLYEFFRLFVLEGLGGEETVRMLETLAEREGNADVSETIGRARGRVETVRRLTGGNPRLLVLAYRMLGESPFGSAREDLESLIDEQTPYFKSRIEELPPQARRVFHCLAGGWEPMLAREVAEAARLSSSHASAQLKSLAQLGFVREVRLPRAKKVRYEVSERFYNIYYLLRFSRDGRERLERLIAFLHDLFGATGLRGVFGATLAAIHGNELAASEAPELLEILGGYVARDRGFEGREEWWQEALRLSLTRNFDPRKLLEFANDILGPDASITDKLEAFFVKSSEEHPGNSEVWRQLGTKLIDAGRLNDAEAACRKAVEAKPDDVEAWGILGFVLGQLGRSSEAVAAIEHLLEMVHPDDPVELRIEVVFGLGNLGRNLEQLDRMDESIAAYRRISEFVCGDDLTELRLMAATGLSHSAWLIDQLDRREDAIGAYKSVLDFVRPDDPAELRALGASCLFNLGVTLGRLERRQDAIAAYDRVLEFVDSDDPAPLRQLAAKAHIGRGMALDQLDQPEDAIAIYDNLLGFVRVNDPAELRKGAAMSLYYKGLALETLKLPEDAIAAYDQIVEYLRPGDSADLREHAASGLYNKGAILTQLERPKDAIVEFDRLTEYVRLDDPAELREPAAKGLHDKGLILWQLGRHEEAIVTYERVREYARPDDPIELRGIAALALFRKGMALSKLDRSDEAISAFDCIYTYVRPDDPAQLREIVAASFSLMGKILEELGRLEEAERSYKKAMEIVPNDADLLNGLAWSMLLQKDYARLSEAEKYARRAVELAPDNANTLHTLSDVLARRNKWVESMDCLERAVNEGGNDWCEKGSVDLTRSFIAAAAAGHIQRVKEIMADAGLTESMEPLWHALRAELGEELEPLPAEVMDAVKEVRRRIAEPSPNPGIQ